MHEEETDPERSVLRLGGISQTAILSVVAAMIFGLGKVHALTETHAAWSLMTALPFTMALMLKISAEG